MMSSSANLHTKIEQEGNAGHGQYGELANIPIF